MTKKNLTVETNDRSHVIVVDGFDENVSEE